MAACGGLIDTGPELGGAGLMPDETPPSQHKELTWMRQFGSAGQDKASTVAFSASGSVLLAGWTSLGGVDNPASVGKTDSFVRRYDSSGNVEWAGSSARPRVTACTQPSAGVKTSWSQAIAAVLCRANEPRRK